jgi:indolepyruvate ferredoxin oxidoreductase
MSDGAAAIGGRMTLTGVEALVRLLVLRRQLDIDAGLDTAAMVSGYPGSPLAGLDLVLEQQRTLLDEHRVLHRPAVNEELALATAWGSQMGAALEYRGVDGVVGVWYGKTPGLDRSGDVLRHANAMGSGPNGGLVLFCGDDPAAKSSTLPCDSQYAFQDACVPVLYPGDQQEVLELGVHAFAMSRLAGPLVALKIVTAVADGSGTVELGRDRYRVRPGPPLVVDAKPWRHQPLGMIGPHRVADQELLIVERRLAAACAYVRQQGLDRVVGAGPGARLGVVTAGKTYADVMQAFADLGVSPDELSRLGVCVLKLAMTYPLVNDTVVEFARSVDALLVIEEKRPFIEAQLRAILHEARCAARVVGKRDREGLSLVSSVGELDAAQVAQALTRVLPELAVRRPKATLKLASLLQPPARPPEYCSGCPHNGSTVVPEGALVGGGVGCHGIVYFEARQRDVQMLPPPPMGAEGVPWIGLAPFVTQRHLFQNLGDGTFSHSGTLAIRASVAAGVHVTFKILYNAAVAMTGGQAVAGLLDVPALTRELEAEGVARIVVCAEQPDRYDSNARWAPGVEILGRDRLQEVQERLREVLGVTVIIYDQRCASEARRLRRRGLLPTPPARVVINEAVCEGCGDCRTKSNCASVLPHQTEFGEKRRVDDLTCNRDYTCLEGNCPSFVTIVPKAKARKTATKPITPRVRPSLPAGELPIPKRAEIHGHFGVYFTGIGGTGVVTAGRILTAAAEAAGLCVSSMDQTGLAQRGGAVVSHLHFAVDRGSLGAASIGLAGADLYLSGDIFQAASANHLARVQPGRTIAAIDREITPTAAMQQTGESPPELAALHKAVTDQIGQDRVVFVASQRIAEQVFSQHVLANVVLLGAAFQLGGLPLSLADIEAGLAQRAPTDANREAFEWGRWAAHDPRAVAAALEATSTDKLTVSAFDPSPKAGAQAKQLLAQRLLPAELVSHLQRRVAQLIDYQNAALGRRFLDLVARVVEHDDAQRGWQLTRSVAESWFKVLTYKDEYEVARLHLATRYDRIARDLGIEGPYTLKYHLQPRQLRRMGFKHKLPLGWFYAMLFVVLRLMKPVRGTAFDVFGWDRDRRLERKVIEEYRQLVGKILELGSVPYASRVELAASALAIKGYDSVKERSVAAWRVRVAELSRAVAAPTPRAAE